MPKHIPHPRILTGFCVKRTSSTGKWAGRTHRRIQANQLPRLFYFYDSKKTVARRFTVGDRTASEQHPSRTDSPHTSLSVVP